MSETVTEMSDDDVKLLVWAMDSHVAPIFAKAYRAAPDAGHLVLRYYNRCLGKGVSADTAPLIRELMMQQPTLHTSKAYEIASHT